MLPHPSRNNPMPSDVVLIHGALGARDQCAPLAAALAALGPLHLPELEGHGATPSAVRPFRVAHFASNVLDSLDAAGVESAAFFGYSLGGYVALWLARHHPARVRRVMTLATKLRWTPALAEREAAMLDVPVIRENVPRFAAQLAARHGEEPWAEVVDATREMMQWMGSSPALGGDDLRAITVPVRLVVGDRDATVSVDECAEARALLPNGELEVLPATPHPFERVPLPRLARSALEFLG